MRGQGHGRGGGRRRRFRRPVGFLEPALLLLLLRGPAHGYVLLDQIKEFEPNEMNPSVIYRALRDMEERGWVSSTWDKDRTQGPPRRIYCLTALGNEMLAMSVKELKMTQDQISYFLNAYRQGMEDKD